MTLEPALVDAAWAAARDWWSPLLRLRPPVQQAGEAVAWLDLRARQVHLDANRIAADHLHDSLEAIFAHEIGHHLRHPASMSTHARLILLERQILPVAHAPLVNLFTDLLINAELGAEHAPRLADVYRAGARTGVRDPVFALYLAVYEELWRLPPGDLLGDPAALTGWPHWRTDAQLVCNNLFGLGPNVYTQFLYFLSVFGRYVTPAAPIHVVLQCGVGEPTADEWATVLTPSVREREAIERALAEGWLCEEEGDALSDVAGRIAALPGVAEGTAHAITPIMAAWYRQEAERWLFRPPAREVWGEAVVPTTLEAWEPGDSPRDIDWLATTRQFGLPLGLAMPQRRTLVAECEGLELPTWDTRMEIYLDVSGSMPDPRRARNVMTLAAQVLALATVRAGGSVRALVYSTGDVRYWTWCRSELEMSAFLLHYIGGGTRFPFAVVRDSVAETRTRPPIRVVITDHDFDGNYDQERSAARILSDAARSPFLLLQHNARPERVAIYRTAGVRVLPVEDLEAFPKVAAALARELFPDPCGGR